MRINVAIFFDFLTNRYILKLYVSPNAERRLYVEAAEGRLHFKWWAAFRRLSHSLVNESGIQSDEIMDCERMKKDESEKALINLALAQTLNLPHSEPPANRVSFIFQPLTQFIRMPKQTVISEVV